MSHRVIIKFGPPLIHVLFVHCIYDDITDTLVCVIVFGCIIVGLKARVYMSSFYHSHLQRTSSF